MSSASTRQDAGARPRIERLQPWIAALLSALLHVLMVLVLMLSTPPIVTSPQGASSGGRVKVDFIGESTRAEPPTPDPPSPEPVQEARPQARPVVRERADPRKPVMEAKFIEPPAEPEPAQADTPEPPAPEPAQAPASSPPATAQRHPHRWNGRPPGWLEEETAPDDVGRGRGPADRDGIRNDMAAGEPSMEVGGYQIVYDLLAEERLRVWMEQGMKELSIPLPGTRYLMVCPAEVALRRESSKCRLLDPNDPQMQAIGDARQVITVMFVYRRGELVWRGPGPYR